MDLLDTPLAAAIFGLVNLAFGFVASWCIWYEKRPRGAADNFEPDVDKVLSVLSEIDEATIDHRESFDSLRDELAQHQDGPLDLQLHVSANRSHGRLLKSYGEQLNEHDPDCVVVTQEFVREVEHSQRETDSFARNLQSAQSERSGVDIDAVLARLELLEKSSESLQNELKTARHVIASQAERLEVSEAAAREDFLTRIANRRAFDQQLDKITSDFSCIDSYHVLLLDLDRFKSINDRYGRTSGDAALQVSARIIQECCRRNKDFAARYGGDEFAVLLQDISPAGAFAFAERVRQRIENASTSRAGQEFQFTCSIGIAQGDPDYTSEQLLLFADGALFRAKEEGKNNIQIWSPADSTEQSPTAAAVFA